MWASIFLTNSLGTLIFSPVWESMIWIGESKEKWYEELQGESFEVEEF